ncbi:hypothetical protein RYA05_35525, partial [Pseudomonas syringae pv. actinidiae]|nr:hypothetical protein [Pseudomonas syringae pv. actinidiae]
PIVVLAESRKTIGMVLDLLSNIGIQGKHAVSWEGDIASHLATRSVRAVLFVSPLWKQRAQGKPGADRTHGSRVVKNAGGRTTGVTGNNPAFPARWVTAYFVLSPARLGLLVTVFATRDLRNVKRHLP